MDVAITKVVYDYDFAKGGQVDYAMFVFREASEVAPYPGYNGGYSDLFTQHPTFFGAAGHWHKELDFSKTPLYLPAHTKILCASSGGSPADPTTQGARSCAVTYRTITPGDVLHRILRIPYQDTGVQPGGTFVTSVYEGTDNRPLKIKGFLLYDGVIGDYTACLQRLTNGGQVVSEQQCLPPTSKTLVANTDSPGITPVDWTVGAGEMISASCSVDSAMGWDCAFYAIAEIPPAATRGPENSFRDYGNVPRSYLARYCANFIEGYAAPSQANMLCLAAGKPAACSKEEQIASCASMYPSASCVNPASADPTAACFAAQ